MLPSAASWQTARLLLPLLQVGWAATGGAPSRSAARCGAAQQSALQRALLSCTSAVAWVALPSATGTVDLDEEQDAYREDEESEENVEGEEIDAAAAEGAGEAGVCVCVSQCCQSWAAA